MADHFCVNIVYMYMYFISHQLCWMYNLLVFVPGVKLTMNVIQREYLAGISDGAGVLVVVHPQHQMPFPEDNAVLAPPGFMTSIALRQVRARLTLLYIAAAVALVYR